jgi:polysaccharide pyruvyl transferase WcaK-like protein
MSINAVLLNDTSVSSHLGCDLVIAQLTKIARRHDIKIVAKCPVGKHWHTVRKHIERSDLCIVNGEGTIHHSSRHGLGLLSVVDYCELLGIPAVLINSLYQANSDQFHEYARRFSLIYVRESFSQQELANEGISSIVVPDLLLSWEHQKEWSRPEGSGIFFNDSVKSQISRQLFDLSLHRPELDSFLPIINRIKPISYDSGFGTFLKSVEKYISLTVKKATLNLYSKMPFATYSPELIYKSKIFSKIDLSLFLETMLRHECLVTGRFHGVCLALLTSTPFLAVPSNSFKIEGMLSDIGIKGRMLASMSTLNEEAFNCFLFSEQEKELICLYLEKAKTGADKMFAEIAGLVNSLNN